MSHPADDDQPLNFGSDLSIEACVENCLEGECCDCDYHRPDPDNSGGQSARAPYQQPHARESLSSVASSGRGPSQPRPIVQPYQPSHPMRYGSASYAERGNPPSYGGYGASFGGHPATYGGYPADQEGHNTNYGGVFIAPQYPPGFTTQASSYPEGAEVTPLQASRGWFRDGAGRLYNGNGEQINEQGEAVQSAASSVPQSSPTSGYSGVGSFRTAPSHRSGSGGGGGGSRASSHHSSHKAKKHKNN